MYARLTGIGGHLPGKPVGNDYFATFLDTSDEWIQSRTGISTRHFAPKGSLVADLALPSVKQALASAKLKPAQLDGIIVATTTPDQLMPGTACLLQSRLGNSGCLAFDIQAACSGFVYALAVANGMICGAGAKHVLVVGTEMYSRILNWEDRATCVLFGDGSGAAVLSTSDQPGIVATDLHADGSQASVISVPGHIAANTMSGSGLFTMDGSKVFKMAVPAMVRSSLEVCRQASCGLEEIDWLVTHQANLRIVNAVAKHLGVRDGGVIRTVVQHANTSAASIPLGLVSVWEHVRPGHKILLTAAGAGFTWGSVLLQA